MRNILSFQPNTKFRGKEIKEWIKYHLENKTSHSVSAKKMEKYLNISDDKEYIIELQTQTSACGADEWRDKPMVISCEKKVYI